MEKILLKQIGSPNEKAKIFQNWSISLFLNYIVKYFIKINDINYTEVPDKGLLCDLLWSDPEKGAEDWASNSRGISVLFNENLVEKALDELDIDLICRAHQVVEEGYEFFAQRKLVTVFSAPNYWVNLIILVRLWLLIKI